MDGQRRTGFIKQIYIMAIAVLVITGAITYAVQRNISEAKVEQDMQAIAANISEELIDSIKEYPAYRWLLRYWHDHADELNLEYDVDFWGDTVTERKSIQFSQRNPGVQIEYLSTAEIGRLSPEDQKLYAEIVYSWLNNRINQIKRNYGVEYLYVVMTPTRSGENPYQTQYFLLSGADPFVTRGREYGEFYLLGTFVEVDESLQDAMRAAVESGHAGQTTGDLEAQTRTYLATGSEFADYYAFVDQINDQAVLVGITYNLSSVKADINIEAASRTAIAVAFQVALLFIVMRFLRHYVLMPLKGILGNIRLYTESKDSDTVVRNVSAILGQGNALVLRRNEIGELGEDIITLANEVDDYVVEIESITTERERIVAELDVAASIQADMLPNIFPPFPERPEFDIFASMTPAKEVGGDFYNYFMIDDDHLGVTIADVSDKGIPAALFMMSSMITIESTAKRIVDPAQALEVANASICAHNNESMFVTAWLGVLEISTGTLVAANAGHEFPIIKMADGDFKLFRDNHGIIMGAMEDARYRKYEIKLKPGSKVFLYTDGAPDAANAQGGRFSTERILKALNSCQDGTPEEVLETVSGAIGEFIGDAEQFDDLTMLCLEYKGL